MSYGINDTNLKKVIDYLSQNTEESVLLDNNQFNELETFLQLSRFEKQNNISIKFENIDYDQEIILCSKYIRSNSKEFIIVNKNTIYSSKLYVWDELLNKIDKDYTKIVVHSVDGTSKTFNIPSPDFPVDIRCGKNLFNKEPEMVPYFRENLSKSTPYVEYELPTPYIDVRKENKMLKLLEIYKGRKVREIEGKYDKKLEELEANDPIQVFIKQSEETLKEMLETETVKITVHTDVVEYTQETIDKKNEIINTIRDEKHKLNLKIDEISALLELAPSYEEKIKILRDYDIMDKKKNIIL